MSQNPEHSDASQPARMTPTNSDGQGRSSESRTSRLRARYIAAIVFMALSWLLWAYATQAVTLVAVGQGRRDFLLTSLIAIPLMVIAWALLPGNLVRRIVAALMMFAYMGSVIVWQPATWRDLLPELLSWRAFEIYTTLMPLVFLAAWLIARRARVLSFLVLLPVALFASLDAFGPAGLDQLLGWRQVLYSGEWIVMLYGTVFGTVSTLVLVGMAWAARNRPISA